VRLLLQSTLSHTCTYSHSLTHSLAGWLLSALSASAAEREKEVVASSGSSGSSLLASGRGQVGNLVARRERVGDLLRGLDAPQLDQTRTRLLQRIRHQLRSLGITYSLHSFVVVVVVVVVCLFVCLLSRMHARTHVCIEVENQGKRKRREGGKCSMMMMMLMVTMH
jgi:hypothetical protein